MTRRRKVFSCAVAILILAPAVVGLLWSPHAGCGFSTASEVGEYILFERERNVYRMDPDGGNVTLVAKNGTAPLCSPSGEKIVFRSEARVEGLFLTDPLDRSTRLLAPDPAVSWAASISKQDIVAFASRRTHQLHTVRITDGATAQHTKGFNEVRVFPWSPDGTRVGFAAAKDQLWAYYVLDYASDRVKQIAASEYSRPSLSWSPDGRFVALIQIRAIEIVDMNTGSSRRLPRDIGILYDVAWSPDGQYLAVMRDDEECGRFSGNIYVIRLSDNTEKKVSNHWPWCRDHASPSWSPDGTKVIFLASRPKGDMDFNPFTKYIHPNIYVVNRDGSGQTNLSGNEDVPDWSPMWCASRRGSR